MFEHWTVGYVFDGLLFATTALFLGWITRLLAQKYVKYFKEQRDRSKARDIKHLERLKKDPDLKMYLGISITRGLIQSALLVVLGIMFNLHSSLISTLTRIGSKIVDDPEIKLMFEIFDSTPIRIFVLLFGALCYITAFLIVIRTRKDQRMLRASIEKPPPKLTKIEVPPSTPDITTGER